MKVKVGNNIYDAEKEPVMLIFDSLEERHTVAKHISSMVDSSLRYAMFPSTEEWEKDNYAPIKKWMDDIPDSCKTNEVQLENR